MDAFAIHLIQTTIGSNGVAKQRNIHSRSRGKWKEYDHLCKLAPEVWKEKHNQEFVTDVPVPETQECSQQPLSSYCNYSEVYL